MCLPTRSRRDADDATGYDVDSAIGLTLDYMTTVNMFYGPKFSICKAAQDSEDFKRLVSESDGQELLFFDNSESRRYPSIVVVTVSIITSCHYLYRYRYHCRYYYPYRYRYSNGLSSSTTKSGHPSLIQLSSMFDHAHESLTKLSMQAWSLNSHPALILGLILFIPLLLMLSSNRWLGWSLQTSTAPPPLPREEEI